jgi:hypothetical protein
VTIVLSIVGQPSLDHLTEKENNVKMRSAISEQGILTNETILIRIMHVYTSKCSSEKKNRQTQCPMNNKSNETPPDIEAITTSPP